MEKLLCVPWKVPINFVSTLFYPFKGDIITYILYAIHPYKKMHTNTFIGYEKMFAPIENLTYDLD